MTSGWGFSMENEVLEAFHPALAHVLTSGWDFRWRMRFLRPSALP
jgi:hypothetical protein